MGLKARSRRFLSPVFTDALGYAAELHADQERKGPGRIPYIGHLLGVASLVLEHGGGETEAIAALLHDALEDRPRGGRTEREIRERFGPRVLRIVEACTDSLDPDDPRDASTWKARKERYVAHIAELRDDAALVSLADKLHNARTIVLDLREHGEPVWDRFSATKGGTLWYYRELAGAFRSRLPGSVLAEELERTVREMRALAASRAGARHPVR
jgi:(p)ppGpp synthase/HD superfamily hydrolase